MNDEAMITAAEIPWGGSQVRESTRPVDLAATLEDTRAFIRRFVVLTDVQADTVALWTAHTHAIEASECTGYLNISSATKRSGKTRLLEVLEPLVRRPWLTGRTSAAVLVRKTHAEQPTLLLDESDSAFGGEKEYAEALRGILNTGYRRSGKASLCVGQGANLEYKDFSTFGPKAIAGIGALPDTVADRSIPIRLRRRTRDEPCERWRERDGHEQGEPLHQRLMQWSSSALPVLRRARPELPPGLGDRQADVWEALLAIADLAGGDWPDRARQAALDLAGSVEDSDIIVELLADVAEILIGYPDTLIATKDLLAKLIEQDDRPWATWRHDKPITGRGLARLLGPLGIHPSDQRVTGRHRSYRVDGFQEAFSRYLPIHVGKRETTNVFRPELAISKRESPITEPTLNFADSADSSAADPTCPLEKPVTRGEDDADLL